MNSAITSKNKDVYLAISLIWMGSVIATQSTFADRDQNAPHGAIIRLYTGDDNQTHAQELEVALAEAPGGAVSKIYPATGLSFSLADPKIDEQEGKWHNGPPEPKYSITLAGAIDIEVAGGKKIPVRPGTILFVEDSTGKGHRSDVMDAEPRLTIQVDTKPLTPSDLQPPPDRTTSVMRIQQTASGDIRKEPFERQIREITPVSGFQIVRPKGSGWKTSNAAEYMTPLTGGAALVAASGARIPVKLGEVLLSQSSPQQTLTVGCLESMDCLWAVFRVTGLLRIDSK